MNCNKAFHGRLALEGTGEAGQEPARREACWEAGKALGPEDGPPGEAPPRSPCLFGSTFS